MNGATVKDKDAVLCLSRSLLYEKTNRGYVHSNPAVLEKYLEAFADTDTRIVDGPQITTCKGCSGLSPHPFLVAEGIFECEVCKMGLCRFCFMTSEDMNGFLEGEGRVLCLDCARASISGLTEGEDESEMRSFLAAKGQGVPASATYLQVLKLFEQAKSGDYDMFENDIKNVKYPILRTSALHPSQPDFERIKTVSVKEIESLFVDDNVDFDVVVDLLHILASLTQLGERQDGEKMSHKHVLPNNVRNMAENARVHTGERLLKRGLRHALDAGSPDILGAMLTLAKHNNQVCIIMNQKVLASMKSVLYAATSAITATDFLAAECTCKAGCTNRSVSDLGRHRVLCTHAITEK
jgi:hypothetical protein